MVAPTLDAAGEGAPSPGDFNPLHSTRAAAAVASEGRLAPPAPSDSDWTPGWVSTCSRDGLVAIGWGCRGACSAPGSQAWFGGFLMRDGTGSRSELNAENGGRGGEDQAVAGVEQAVAGGFLMRDGTGSRSELNENGGRGGEDQAVAGAEQAAFRRGSGRSRGGSGRSRGGTGRSRGGSGRSRGGSGRSRCGSGSSRGGSGHSPNLIGASMEAREPREDVPAFTAHISRPAPVPA